MIITFTFSYSQKIVFIYFSSWKRRCVILSPAALLICTTYIFDSTEPRKWMNDSPRPSFTIK